MDKWQSAYIDTAERFASLSTATRLKVGCIAVKDNRILSIGYNGMPSGWSNMCERPSGSTGYLRTKDEVIHAEMNCLAKLASSNESGKGAELYITHAPCIECSKMIYASGIIKVYYRTEFRDMAGVNFLRQCGVGVEQI
jgi:dCMP deaminase